MRRKGRPFLGICVGAQLMAERGLEFRVTPGFGWIKGDVKAIEPQDPALKIPHMGWNTLNVRQRATRCSRASRPGQTGCTPTSCTPSTSSTPDAAALVAEADYGGPVTAMVGRDNIAGTQFHPEKSQTLGLAAHRQLPEVAALRAGWIRPPRVSRLRSPGTQRHCLPGRGLLAALAEPMQRRIEQDGVGLDLLDQQAVLAFELRLEPRSSASARSSTARTRWPRAGGPRPRRAA